MLSGFGALTCEQTERHGKAKSRILLQTTKKISNIELLVFKSIPKSVSLFSTNLCNVCMTVKT
jgi:hypothetical protein